MKPIQAVLEKLKKERERTAKKLEDIDAQIAAAEALGTEAPVLEASGNPPNEMEKDSTAGGAPAIRCESALFVSVLPIPENIFLVFG
jgi:hypothetical protein